MTKLYTLFSSSTSLDALLTDFNTDEAISDLKVFGNAEEGGGFNADPIAVRPPAGMGQTGAGVIFVGSELEAEGLSDEISAYFSRNMENGARVIVLDTTDVDSTKAKLEAAGGIISEGG